MTQEEKQLLLKDLCGRLPYGVICDRLGHTKKLLSVSPYKVYCLEFDNGEYMPGEYKIEDIKPCLRPMYSITQEELKELNDKYGNIAYFFMQDPPYYYGLQAQHSDIGSIEISEFSEIYDWLNAHHFDYRFLIEKGLALEVLKDMYKNE